MSQNPHEFLTAFRFCFLPRRKSESAALIHAVNLLYVRNGDPLSFTKRFNVSRMVGGISYLRHSACSYCHLYKVNRKILTAVNLSPSFFQMPNMKIKVAPGYSLKYKLINDVFTWLSLKMASDLLSYTTVMRLKRWRHLNFKKTFMAPFYKWGSTASGYWATTGR